MRSTLDSFNRLAQQLTEHPHLAVDAGNVIETYQHPGDFREW